MLTRLAIVLAAAVAGAIAGYVMWVASHRSGLLGLFSGVILGLVAVALAVLIGFLMLWTSGLP